MTDKIAKMINHQINFELYSAYLYLEMSDYYAHAGLMGFANWFTVQTKEELDHAGAFRVYLLDNGIPIVLEPITDPRTKFTKYIEPLRLTLTHEKQVTESIHAIYHEAMEERDYRTMQFLDVFIAEQAEEEKNATEMISKMTLFGEDPKSLYLLDQELAARTYTPFTVAGQTN